MKRILSLTMSGLLVFSIFAIFIKQPFLHTHASTSIKEERIVDEIGTPVHNKNLRYMLWEAGLLSETLLELPSGPMLPVSGDRELLTILVEFPDLLADPSHDDVHFENMMWGPKPSLSDYYTEVSYGAFTYIQGLVLDPGADSIAPFWYTSTYSISPPGGWTSSNSRELAREAMTMADADIDYSVYDANLDGTVTNEELTILIVTSGVAAEMGGDAPWSHHSWADPSWVGWPLTPTPVPTGDDVSVEGEYSMTSEANPVGTVAHEFGHDLGLPDLYDTDGGSEGIGHYGLMGSGCWLGPAHMTAWSKIQLGWIDPTIITVSGAYDVRDVETNAEAYILYDPDYSLTEYFLIENRWKGNSYDSIIGREGDLDDEGISIYHVDEEMGSDWWGTSRVNNVNQDETHKMIDVESAEHPSSHFINADDLDAEVNSGDSDDLWDIDEYNFNDASTPCNANWYSGAPSGVKVSEFPATNHTMRVNISHAHDILIVDDNDGSPYANGTSLPEFESALTEAGYDYVVWNESSIGNPPLNFLTKFKLVIWTCGDYYDWAVDPTDAATLESYLAQGGNILLEGEDIGWNHKENGFMTNVAHAIFGEDNTGALGLTVTAPTHPVTQGLPTNFTWLTDPPFDDGVNTTNGGFEVIRYTNTSWTAVTVFNGTETGYGSVVYYAFPIFCLNQTERDKLIINSVDWLLLLRDILIVDDNDGSGHEGRGTSLPEFESALTEAGYDYVVWNESSIGNPPLNFLTKFKLVIWTCGDYYDWAVDPTDAATLESYLAQGGNILLEGESIGYDHRPADDFMVNVAHATFQNYSTPVPGLTVTDPNHHVTFDLPTNFTWLNGEPPTYTEGASPTNGGAEVIQYTGTNTTAVTVFDGAGVGSVVYYAFPIYCLNQTERDKLVINSVNWLFPRAPGDANGDGLVDASDLTELSKVYGSDPSKPKWNPNCDFNRDQRVDALDLFDLGKNYGKTI